MPQLILNNIFYSVDEEKKSKKISEKLILKNISFGVDGGSIVGIAGESGSGKTTLAKIIAGIIKPKKGSIIFHKSKYWGEIKTSPIQILFQNNGEILNPFREIYNVVSEAYSIRFNDKINCKAETEKIFNLLNFPQPLWHRKGFELSGGEQQRAALARILITHPELLILDEPFSAQDPISQLNLLNLFKKINNQLNLTMICIAHNLKILGKLCDEILIMYNGEIIENGKPANLFTSPQHRYTQLLLKAENYNLSFEELESKEWENKILK